MKKMMAFVTAVVAMGGMAMMYFSSEILPVYINGQYKASNQVIRYFIYAVLALIAVHNLAILCTPSRKRKNVRRR